MSDCPQISLTVPNPQIQLCAMVGGTHVMVTGSSALSIANFTGIDGFSIFTSGGYVFLSGGGGGGGGDVTYADLLAASGALVSQISAASAGVLALNGQSGFLSLQGLGGVSVSTSGQTILISGSAGTLSTGDLSGYVLKSQQINGYPLTGNVTVTATDIPVGIVPGAGYTNLQQFINTMHSPGLIDGAILSDGGSGNLSISAGTGMLRVADDNVSSLLFVTIPPASLPVPQDLVQYYAGFAYNTGNPQFQLRSADNWDKDTEIPLGTVVNFFGQLVVKNNPFLVGDPITNIIQRFDAMAPIVRDEIVGGMIIGEGTGRHITLSAGKLWTRLNDYTVPAMNTAGVDVMYAAYYNGLYWNYVTPTTQWDNTSYNDISVGLLPVPVFYYSALWFYITVESNALGYIYDQNIYPDLTSASLASPPSFLPDNFTVGSILLGRLIFQNGSTSAVQLDSAFDTTFSPAPVTTHNNLAGLQGGAPNEYYHLSNAQYTALTGDASLPTVFTLNGLSGYVGVVGAGSVSASLSGNNIVVSGSAEAGSYITTGQTGQFASAAALTQTGIDLLALIAGSTAGVSSFNTATGAILATGAGNIAITRDGQTFIVSGDTGAYANFATTTQLTQTGAILDSKVNSLSGFVGNVSGGLEARIVQTGSAVVSHANSIGVSVSGALTQTGVTLGAQIIASGNSAVLHANGIGTNLSGNLAQTGATLIARDLLISGVLATGIAATGQAAWISANGAAAALSGNLTQTGITLLGLISAASAGVSSLNGASGTVNLAGAGNVFVTTAGQTITVSGDTGAYVGFATVANLAATGSSLYATLTGMSGQDVTNYATIANLALTGRANWLYTSGVSGNLATTGSTLDSKINALSGFVGQVSGGLEVRIAQTGQAAIAALLASSGALQTNLATSGSNLYVLATGLSGATNAALIATGASAVTHANGIGVNLSGALTQSGSTLYVLVTGLSGATNAGLIATGNAAVAHANGVGVNLSGNLTQTGVALIARDLLVSGWLSTGLAQTGSAAVVHANGIGTNLSGALATTGVTLYTLITGASGQANTNFATIANLAATGTTLYVLTTGLSGAVNTALIATGASAVTHANGNATNLSGALTQTGVSLIARDLIISGQLYTGIAQTGSTLNTQTLGLSGYLISLISAASAGVSSLNGSSGVLTLAGTGGLVVLTNGQTILVSGNLDPANFPTNAMVTGMSGSLLTTIIATGASAVTHANGIGSNLSGNLTATGAALLARDLITSGTLATGIAATGQAAWISANGASSTLSGLLTLTGQTLGLKVDVLSGFTTGVSGFLQAQISALPTAINLALTGSNLYALVTGLSGATNTLVIASGAATIAHANGIGSINSGNLTATGSTLYVLATGLSGSVNTLVIATGASAVTHANGIGLNLSGNLIATGLKITVLSGYVESGFIRNNTATGFITGMATGVQEQYINHFAFPRIPFVQLTADYINVPMVHVAVSGRSTTGFYAIYSDTVLETGNQLMVWASI